MSAIVQPRLAAQSLADRPHRAADLDMFLEEISPGWAVFTTCIVPSRGDASLLHASGPGTTLVEFALAAAVQSKLPPSATFTIEEFSVTFDKATVPARTRMRATACARAVSRRHILAEGTVSCGRGHVALRAKLLAYIAP